MDMVECLLHFIHAHSEMMADGDCRQRIVHGKCPRQRHGKMRRHIPDRIVGNTERAVLGQQLFVHGTDIRILRKAAGLHLTGMPQKDLFKMRIIGIENAQPALLKQQALAVQIVVKILVLVGSDVIRLDIGKNADLKGHPVHTVHHQALRRHLHHTDILPGIRHPAQILLYRIRLRCRVERRRMLLANDRLDGSDQSHMIARIFQNRPHHVGRRRLALCPRDPDAADFICRVVEIRCRQLGQCLARIRHLHDGHIAADIHRLFHDDHLCAIVRHRRRVRMPVHIGTADTYKQAALARFPGIVDQFRNIAVDAAL